MSTPNFPETIIPANRSRAPVVSWPMRSRCTRSEKNVLKALRLLAGGPAEREQAKRLIESLGIGSDGMAAFAQLSLYLVNAGGGNRLLGHASSYVGQHELAMLRALKRCSQASAEPPPRSQAVESALWDVAAILRAAGVNLSSRLRVWPGSADLEKQPMEPQEPDNRRLRSVEVTAVRQISPGIRRVTLGGSDLADLPEGAPTRWAKIFLPPTAVDEVPVGRAYTLREYRKSGPEVDIDIALHGDGPLSTWAATAEPGHRMLFAGPRGGYAPDPESEWLLLAGDNSALPAISTILESLPAGFDVRVFLLLDAPGDLAAIPSGFQETARWTTVDGNQKDAGALLDLVRIASLPSTPGQVWAAGEASLARQLREHFRFDRRLPSRTIHCVGYWKQGDQDHKDMAAG